MYEREGREEKETLSKIVSLGASSHALLTVPDKLGSNRAKKRL